MLCEVYIVMYLGSIFVSDALIKIFQLKYLNIYCAVLYMNCADQAYTPSQSWSQYRPAKFVPMFLAYDVHIIMILCHVTFSFPLHCCNTVSWMTGRALWPVRMFFVVNLDSWSNSRKEGRLNRNWE